MSPGQIICPRLKLTFGVFTRRRITIQESNSPSLRWTAAIVRNRSHVSNQSYFDAGRLNRSHSGFTTRAWTLYPDLAGMHSKFARRLSCSDARLLRGERRSLSRTVKAERPRRGLTDQIALQVRDRNKRIVEARLNVNDALRHHPSLFSFECFLFASLGLSFCHKMSL